LDRGEQGDFIAWSQNIVPGLVIDADGDQGGFAHGGQLRKAQKDLIEKVVQPGTRWDANDDLGGASQVFKVGIKMDAHLHREVKIQEFGCKANPNVDKAKGPLPRRKTGNAYD